MSDIYHETIDRAFLALSHSENMLEILRLGLKRLAIMNATNKNPELSRH